MIFLFSLIRHIFINFIIYFGCLTTTQAWTVALLQLSPWLPKALSTPKLTCWNRSEEQIKTIWKMCFKKKTTILIKVARRIHEQITIPRRIRKQWTNRDSFNSKRLILRAILQILLLLLDKSKMVLPLNHPEWWLT